MSTPFDYFTVNQAAVRAGLKPDTIRDLIHRGLLPALQPGREWLIRPRDLDRYLRNRRPAGRPRSL